MRPRRLGFTLLEMSLVLLIIGLIAGGIIIARTLIDSAKIQKTIRQVTQLNNAIAAFKGKYDCLPGDCYKATQLGLGDSGDGDGTPSGWSETTGLWAHLSASGFYTELRWDSGNYADLSIYGPKTAAGNGRLAFYSARFAYWSAAPTENFGITRLLLCCDIAKEAAGVGSFAYGLSPAVAEAIDTKLDDGNPFSGAAKVLGDDCDGSLCSENTYPLVTTEGDTGCVYPSGSVYYYNVTQVDPWCNLSYRLPIFDQK